MAVTPMLSVVSALPETRIDVERATPRAPAPEVAHAAEALIAAYRWHGHRAAAIDPLSGGKEPFSIRELDPRTYGLLVDDSVEVSVHLGGVRQTITLAALVERLRASYCDAIALECAHVRSEEQRDWLYARVEALAGGPKMNPTEAKRLLASLVAAEAFEHRRLAAYAQYKQFNLEGGESFVPLLRALIERAARDGAENVVLAMPHRGRLNAMLNALDVPAERLLTLLSPNPDFALAKHDLRDHAGLEGRIDTGHSGIEVTLLHNPSHLEAVIPVACGTARALQDRKPDGSRHRVLPVLVHGDGSFTGQGVVAETLNLAQTRGYGIGGTLHLILNNQIGSTIWNPRDQRSTQYCADLARGFDAPIVHVNADEPEEVVAVGRIASEFRQKFAADIVVDHVGYRRYGHWVGDDPSLTRPSMQSRIDRRPSVATLYAQTLVRRGVVPETEIDRLRAQATAELVAAAPRLAASPSSAAKAGEAARPRTARAQARTAVPIERLRALIARLASLPEGFTPHASVAKVLVDWQAIAGGEDRLVDWRLAENLAYATLLANGFNVRLTGLDIGRGSHCHRLHVWHDRNGADDWRDIHVPLRCVAEGQGTFSIFETPLSEEAVLGFEYGYSLFCGRDLVAWEAQFGDFVNNAQVIIDQFIATGEAKWDYRSGLVMLLPHGEDGLGPEHSCAFLSRFLQLCARSNMRVVLPSTAAQIYHLLRRHALGQERTPLVVMTPHPWLYAHAPSHARLADLADGAFEPLLGESAPVDRASVRRAIVTTGKLYYDLVAERQLAGIADVPILRAEELYPFPASQLARALARYPGLEQVVWTQEEPKNHGAWYHVREALESALPAQAGLAYAGRPESAPSAGADPARHAAEQRSLARSVLGLQLTERDTSGS